jgi:hypothetical protein
MVGNSTKASDIDYNGAQVSFFSPRDNGGAILNFTRNKSKTLLFYSSK